MASTSFDLSHLPAPVLQERGNDRYIAYFWNPLPAKVDQFITSTPEIVRSWKTDCPVQKSDLAYAQIDHWNAQGKVQTGEMIVNVDVIEDVGKIFGQLYGAQYPIEKMQLIDCYDADDDRSMENNNTSAFCSRAITDQPGKFSVHSYGRAIDVNPRENPYIRQREDGSFAVYPQNTPQEFIENPKIRKGEVCQRAFESHGWRWGGDWTNPKDFQHFEKVVQ